MSEAFWSFDNFYKEDGEPLIFELRQGEKTAKAKVVDISTVHVDDYYQGTFFRSSDNKRYYVDREKIGLPKNVLAEDQITFVVCSGEYIDGEWSERMLLTIEKTP